MLIKELPRASAVLERAPLAQIGGQIYVSRCGRVLVDAAFGLARAGAPMRTDTLMLWLSACKPITAVAIAQLAERSLLDLRDPVCLRVPEFGAAGKEGVTIGHLLTHTGGFRPADRLPPELDWDEMLRAICQTPLESGWVPGESAGYHTGSSWFILGEIIRRVSGRSFAEFVAEEILRPVGMDDSWVAMPPEEFESCGDRIGLMHDTAVSPPAALASETAAGWGTPRPGGNCHGPIRELGRFYEMLLAGGEVRGNRVLKRETVALFTGRRRCGLFDQTFRHKLDTGYGFILNSNEYGTETVPYGYGRHASPETFGHSGAQSSCAFADPARGLAVAWVLNGMPGERAHQARARDFNSAIYADLDALFP